MSNSDIRKKAAQSGIPLWKVGRELGISEATISRKLREELPETERKRWLEAIDRLIAAGEGGF